MGDNQSRPEAAAAAASEQASNQTSLEPAEVITRQSCSESVEEIKGKDGDLPAWHIILVPYEKQAAFKRTRTEPWIRINDFGCNIRYRDKAGAIRQASGFGTAPPEQLMKWINENYDPLAIDENTPLTYTIDDIRLCTIQRVIPEEVLGICLHYHRHERFHYIKLSADYESTLAFRAGIKSFDRIIEYNGINIEGDSTENLKKKIDDSNNQIIQLLICSPATYAHYKTNKKHLDSNLDTVKRLKPVHDTASPLNNYQIKETKDSLACITLVNSEHTIGNSCTDTQFITAEEPRVTGTIENKPVLMNERNISLKTLTNQTSILHEKKGDNRERKECDKQKLVEQLTSLLVGNQNNAENGIEIFHTQCHGCGSPRIYEDRYKCLECHNYDLCGRCFDQRCETDKHKSGHVMIHFSGDNEIFGEPVVDINTTVTLKKFKEKYSNEEHANLTCDICKITPIKGLQFKCDVCHNYDLCITCMERRIHDQTHPLIAMGKYRFREISMDDIELNDELGRGGFGTVYKAKWLSKNRLIACKVINARPEHIHHEKSFRKELAAYAELSGPYILKTYGYNIEQLDDDTRKCTLVMEYMPRGSLTNVLRQKEKLPLRRKLEMACQIASGMRKLHAHRMIHRDIRPDNILVTEDYTAKIGDMGLARVWLPDVKLTTIGCLPYMPLDFYSGKYDQSLDIYTFGLTINQLFTEKQHQFDLLTRRIELTKPSPVFADLITRCIHKDPSQRPTAIEIETTLRMYKQAVEKYILEKNIKYARMSTEEKNSTFITVYEALQPELDKLLKNQFPPPCPAGQLADGMNGRESEFFQLLKILELLGVR